MAMPGSAGYQPRNTPAERRAFFDLKRQIDELESGAVGPPGPPGEGVPPGGTDGQVLTKTSSANYATAWETPTGGGGGGTDEVWIGTTEPTDPLLELWYDPDAVAKFSWAYTHNQDASAAVWTIDHNLGFMPNIQVIDSSGANVEGDVAYPTPDRVVLTFSGSFSGVAHLS